MHICPPPKEALAAWLEANGTIAGENYGHLLLEQRQEIDEVLLDALRPYFESAHSDARMYFHRKIGISMHPDAGRAKDITYPNCLPPKALRGLFGEVMAGLVTEAYQAEFIGGHTWRIPIFLFREHDDVEKYLWALRFDPGREREIYGRHGTDFIAIALNAGGEVVRVIAGEAKWRKTLTDSVVAALLHGPKVRKEGSDELEHDGKGIWFDLNRDSVLPHGLRQMQFLLEQRDPEGHASAILSIDKAVLELSLPPERTDLVVICGNRAATRERNEPVVEWDKMPDGYKAGRDLQVVEVSLEGDGNWIDAFYKSLWSAV